jgi:hydrogenase expression/formation protein HypE
MPVDETRSAPTVVSAAAASGRTVLLGHGGGGKLTQDLIARVFLPSFENPALRALGDSAVLGLPTGGRIAFTTDSYVVKPLFFPGGDVGRIAVCGTVNDLAMSGARPLFVSAAFIVEEGLPIETLAEVARSMRLAADEAGVAIVTGDTKVVERGGADGLFVTTAGVGVVPDGVDVSVGRARPGDAILVSGAIGDHGIAIAVRRAGIEMTAEVVSDAAPLNGLVEAMLASGAEVRALRDATRGGLAAVLNEMASASSVNVTIKESAIPVHGPVQAACDLLGFDPLSVANEGKLVAVVAAADALKALAALRLTRYGEEAALIGEITAEPRGKVLLKTRIGGTRIVAMPSGELLPRIC